MRKELQTRQVVANYTTRHKRKLMNAQLGNNAGTVETGTADFWWIRLHGDDNQVVRARSSRDVVPNAGIDVVVELVQREGLPYYQILGRALGILYPTEPYANRVVGHHEQHEQGDAGAGGFDPVSVFPRMVAPLRAHEETVPAMTVYVDAGDAAIGSTHLRFLGGSSPAFSNPTTFNRFDLLYLGTDNALHVLAGTEASGWVTPTRPTMTTAGVPIAWVLLTASMTTILEGDIYDAGILRTGIELSSAVDLAATIHAATSKATPVDADEMPLADSAAAFGLKKLTWANLKATLKTYLDTLYAVLAHTHTGAADSPNLADEVILHDKVGSPALFTLHDDFITRGATGVADGTQTYVTVGSTAVKISVIAGDGYVRLTNDQQGELVFCHWAAAADLYTFSAPAAGQENTIFIGVEYSAGTAAAVAKAAFTDWNWYTNFPLARCSYDGTTMRIANLYAHAEDTANLARKWMRLTHPFIREEAPEGTGGLEVSDAATRQLAMTAGNILHGFNRLILNAIAAGTTFYTYYRRAGGGFNNGTATQWENTLYDDASGTLQTMTNNRYGTRWIYLDVSGNTVGSAYNGSLAMVYGSSNATSVALAQAETAPSIPAHLQYHGRLIGRIIFQKSAAAATLVESAWTNAFSASAVGNHNLLSGLQGGTTSEYYHLTSAEYTGTGTNNFVRESSPTIVTPTIASFTNAQHDHTNAAGGGTHHIINAHSYAGGNALDLVGLSATSTLAVLTPSSSPVNAKILCSTSAGNLFLVNVWGKTRAGSTNSAALGAQIALYHNNATGLFTLDLSPNNLTADRQIFFPDSGGTVALVGAAPTAHNILSASHGDTTPAAAVRGDIITAQGVAPTWTRLAKGAQYTVLGMGANEPAWSGFLLDGTTGGKTVLAVTNAKVLTITTAETTGLTLAPGAASKTLTLTYADSYNLTIPATGTAALLATANVFTATQTISNTAPSLVLTDTTASAKGLTIAVDANLADLRESAGAAASLMQLDLANSWVGLGVTPTMRLQVSQTFAGTNDLQQVASFDRWSSGTPADGMGCLTRFGMPDAGGTLRAAGQFGALWEDATNGYAAFIIRVKGAAGAVEKIRFSYTGNVKIAGTAVRGTTEGTNHLDIFDGTAPAGTLTNGVSLYSASGELRSMDSAGNSTLLSPHSKQGDWIFYSKNTVTGRVLRIEMEKMMKALNQKFGWDYIQEYVESIGG